MKIIASIFVILLCGCKTAQPVQKGESSCNTVVFSPAEEKYAFYNWYYVDSAVCEVQNFSIKDLNGFRHGYFKNGKQNGQWISYRYYHYDSSGYIHSKKYLAREEYFKDGLRDSVYKIYNEAGQVIYSTLFTKGTGVEKDYYDNGQLYYKVEAKEGYFTDTLKLFTRQGKLKDVLLYKKDSLVYHNHIVE